LIGLQLVVLAFRAGVAGCSVEGRRGGIAGCGWKGNVIDLSCNIVDGVVVLLEDVVQLVQGIDIGNQDRRDAGKGLEVDVGVSWAGAALFAVEEGSGGRAFDDRSCLIQLAYLLLQVGQSVIVHLDRLVQGAHVGNEPSLLADPQLGVVETVVLAANALLLFEIEVGSGGAAIDAGDSSHGKGLTGWTGLHWP
jgi:hypothetical protein